MDSRGALIQLFERYATEVGEKIDKLEAVYDMGRLEDICWQLGRYKHNRELALSLAEDFRKLPPKLQRQ